MLKISKHLIELLDKNDVTFCSWKNNQSIEAALSGTGDVDLLIASKDQAKFSTVILELGFKEGVNKKLIYPRVHHFYGLDTDTGIFLHLHVYFEIITGESHTKNYRIPIETEVLSNLVLHQTGIKVPNPNWQMLLILIRHFIKITSLPGALLYIKEKDDYQKEKALCSSLLDNGRFEPPKIAFLENSFINMLYQSYIGKSFLKQVFIGFSLRRKIDFLSRLAFFPHFFERYKQIYNRLVNKLVYKRKKANVNGGRVIAICGLDGTGKSTTVELLYKWLASDFDCRVVHIGRPKPTLITFPLRVLLWIRKLMKSQQKKQTKTDKSVEHYIKEEQKKGTLVAIRFVALAYERSNLIRKTNKLRESGFIVVCDRFPSLTFGKMDSARVYCTDNSNFIVKWCAKKEKSLYGEITPPDQIIKLHVPVDVAIDRNNNRIKDDKETDNELIARYRNNTNLKYHAINYDELETTIPVSQSIAIIQRLVWNIL